MLCSKRCYSSSSIGTEPGGNVAGCESGQKRKTDRTQGGRTTSDSKTKRREKSRCDASAIVRLTAIIEILWEEVWLGSSVEVPPQRVRADLQTTWTLRRNLSFSVGTTPNPLRSGLWLNRREIQRLGSIIYVSSPARLQLPIRGRARWPAVQAAQRTPILFSRKSFPTRRK